MRGENAETSEEKENQARDQNLGKSQGWNKCHLPAWGCQGTNFCLQLNGNETQHMKLPFLEAPGISSRYYLPALMCARLRVV